jgi:MarR family 2-MHQ and catechol resistance regulon transcriptional repressor
MKRDPSVTQSPGTPGVTPAPAAETAEATALKLLVVLSRAHAAVTRHTEADIVRHGLTPTEFAIVEALYHRGPLLLGEVQRKILVSSGGITYLVDRLVAKGLVQRQECPEDRRARYAALTPDGRALLDRIFPEHARSVRHAMAGLTEAEQAQAIALLRRLGTSAASRPPLVSGA